MTGAATDLIQVLYAVFVHPGCHLVGDGLHGAGIGEVCRTHLHRRGTGHNELQGVAAGGNAAQAHHRDVHGTHGLPYHAQSNGAHRRAGQTRKDVVEHRAALFQINGAGLEGVGQADGVRAGGFHSLAHLGDVLGLRAQLDHQGLFAASAHHAHHLTGSRGLDAVGHAAHLDVGAGDVQLHDVHCAVAQHRGTFHVLFLAVAAKVGNGHRAVLLLQFQHLGQLHVNEVLHAGVLQADAVDKAGGGLPQALAPVAVLAVQGQALAGDAADLCKVCQLFVLHAVAHGAGCADDRAVHHKAQQVGFQVSHQKNTSVASNTGPFLHTLLPSPLFVSQVQPRQAPMPQAIFFSMLTKQGVPFSAHRRAALRIMVYIFFLAWTIWIKIKRKLELFLIII